MTLLINLTNPSGIVVAAARRETGVRLISMCDSPVSLCRAIAERLGRRAAATVDRYLGMNHVGWWVPGDARELDAVGDLATGLDADDIAADGALGGPYVRYYAHPERILAAQMSAEPRASQLQRLEADLLTGYAAGATSLPRRGAAWYPSAVIPLMDAWLYGAAEPMNVGLLNEGRVPALPDEVLIEAPFDVPRPRTLVPISPVSLPARPMALLARHAAYEAAVVDALASGSRRDDLVAALSMNPIVRGLDQAATLVDVILANSPS
jgi:6-phospho-beta-glucosidase